MRCQSSPRVTSLPKISTSSYLESKRRLSSGCSSVITTVATAPATAPRKLVCSIGLIALHRPRISKDRAHDEHPPARNEVRQVVRQALDVLARLLLPALHLDDLRDEHVVGLTDRLSGHVRRPHKTPVRHRVRRPARFALAQIRVAVPGIGQLAEEQDARGARALWAPLRCATKRASRPATLALPRGTTSTRPCSDAPDARFTMAKEESRESWARR